MEHCYLRVCPTRMIFGGGLGRILCLRMQKCLKRTKYMLTRPFKIYVGQDIMYESKWVSEIQFIA